MRHQLDTAPVIGREEWAGIVKALAYGVIGLAGIGLMVWGALALLFWALGWQA